MSGPRIIFILPVRGGSGGAHSVMQEVTALRDLSVDACIAVNERNVASFRSVYERFDWIAEGVLSFIGPKDLSKITAGADLVIATTNTSAHTIAESLEGVRSPSFRVGYYVQDYEPLFYDAASIEHTIAVGSFAVLKNCTYFAKTRWLCDIVQMAHAHDVAQVVPSIDHSLYRPGARSTGGRRRLCAMVRPETPRRAPRRTIDVLSRAAAGEFGPMDVLTFGVDAEELAQAGYALPEGVELIGKLKQPQVAELLQSCDFFLDLSDYQAFGRTAAEAMACGCVALAPVLGGAPEFIEDGVSSFLADTTSPDSVTSALQRMVSMSDAELRSVRFAGLEAVSGFTPVRAAVSELRAWGFG